MPAIVVGCVFFLFTKAICLEGIAMLSAFVDIGCVVHACDASLCGFLSSK